MQSALNGLAKSLEKGFHKDAHEVSATLQAEMQLGSSNMTYDELLQFIGRNWNDFSNSWGEGDGKQAFRPWLLENWGPDQMRKMAQDAASKGYLPAAMPLPPPPVMPVNPPMSPAPQMAAPPTVPGGSLQPPPAMGTVSPPVIPPAPGG